MKLTSLAVLFTVIVFPFLTLTRNQMKMIKEDARLRAYYDSVIDNAVQDAAFVISRSVKDFSYGRKGDACCKGSCGPNIL